MLCLFVSCLVGLKAFAVQDEQGCEDFDMSKTVPLKAGSYMKHPAKAVHFDGAKDEEVIVLITGIGPGTTTLVKQ
jgi:hypothetical protein